MPSLRRSVIRPQTNKTQNSMQAVSALGRALDPAIELLVQALNRVGRVQSFPLFWRVFRKVNSLSPAFSRLKVTARHLSHHLAIKAVRLLGASSTVWAYTNVAEVGLDLVVQVLGRMGEQVALLVNRAALDRDIGHEAGQRRLRPFAAVEDHQLRRLQPAGDQIIQHGAPSGFRADSPMHDPPSTPGIHPLPQHRQPRHPQGVRRPSHRRQLRHPQST